MELVIQAMKLLKVKLVEGLALTRSIQSQRPEKEIVLLQLKAWGLLKEHGSKVDLLPREAGPQKMSLQKKPPEEKGRTPKLLFLFLHNLSHTLCAAESPLRSAA